MVKVGMVSLGCSKNQVDGERLLALLGGREYQLCADPAQCQVVIINTCGFIEDAKQESIDTILEFAQEKGRGSLRCIVVTGCLAERYREELAKEYVRHIAATVPGEKPFAGMRVLVDCANGSASRTAGELFEQLGANADIICREPDGVNVNQDCGSTHIHRLREMVKAGGYALGVAFDGDADRCLAVDETGVLVDGDQMIAIFATEMKRKGSLRQNTAVVTVMSNYGFMNFARESGITVKTTKVGDRYVLETMLAEGYNIGGEQSGHIIFTDYMTTGDGQLSAIQLMAAMKETGKTLSQLTKVITILPQVLVNMEATVDMKAGLAESLEISAAVRACEEELAGEGRVLIRPSGTEPLIRVMVEGPSQEQITDIAHRIVKAIQETLS